MSETTLRISEIFYSLQGESTRCGLPTVFIRLTGCPLRCVWCDTAYAFNGGQKMSLDAILQQVKSFNTRYVTVTGGEPLAQPACLDLIRQLADEDYRVSLETSGALDISAVDERVVNVMDLKAPGSGEENKNRFQNIEFLKAQDEIKFVLANESDYQWAKARLEEFQLASRCQVLFSPVMGEMSPTWLADQILSDQLPVRFQIQLHKNLWADAQGK